MQIESLSNLCNKVSYGYTASAIKENTGIKFLRITDIQHGVVNWDSVPFCNIEERLIGKYLLNKNDIVVARTGNSTGENYLYKGNISTVFASYLIRFCIDPNKAFPAYVWWNMRTANWWNFINNVKTGAAQAGANAKVLGRYPIKLHSYAQQKAIAKILGTLDDKIELNQKMNQTLEDIAKAIFKSWFVDFDPVRAKVEGRPTGLPPEISDLFPDEFVDSELGKIPKGWNFKRVEMFADALLGGTPSRNKPNYWGGQIPWINSGAVNEFRVIKPSEYITQEGHDKSSTKLLPAKTTVIAITGATLGQVSYLEIDSCANQSVVGVIPHDNNAHEWIYLTFTSHIDRLINRQTGGAQQHINKNDVLDFEVIYPTEVLIASFTELASPLFKRIGIAVRENLILSELRDTLLPKLISGELRIPDLEKFLKEAGI